MTRPSAPEVSGSSVYHLFFRYNAQRSPESTHVSPLAQTPSLRGQSLLNRWNVGTRRSYAYSRP